jgi:predicted ATP-binding protein involved in virulence
VKKLYISQLKLKNIKCFDEIFIDFENDSKSVLWSVILGDNAVGKTTLLRSIAMGLCDEASAAALMKESPTEYLRKNEKDGSIEITLKKNKTGKEFKIKTEIIKKSLDSPEKVIQSTNPDTKFPWKDIFICGYGVFRIEGSTGSDFKKYSQLDALYSLFVNEALMDPELIMLRQDEILRKSIEKILLSVLMLDEKDYSFEFTPKGMVLNGPWGTMNIKELSDGYQSTMNWVIDFFGWQIFADRINKNVKISGILLIDELENHLHPKWQREIIHRLKKQFPNVQFIVTTHSPLIASSMGELKKNENHDKLIYLELKDNNIVEISELESLKGLDVDQVLASKAFDYLIDADHAIEKVLKEASILAGKGNKRSSSENKRYKEIKGELKKIWKHPGKTLIEREVREEIYNETIKKIRKLEKKIFSEIND